MNWTCPHCQQPLSPRDNSLVCPANHCFDRAKEGYVNLLPSNRKRSKDPGDNREMVDARRRVHANKLYQPLADRIGDALGQTLHSATRWLDLGCGEGFYSAELVQRFSQVSLQGIDVSKPAVRCAAKACRGGQFAVASAFDVPMDDASVDAAFSVFAPTSDTELKRLVAPGGCFLNVAPGPDHLWELRQLIYRQPRPHAAPESRLDGFEEVSQQSLQFQLDLEGQQLQDLIAMTPYAYGGRRESKQQLQALDTLVLRAAFVLSLHRRQSD